MLDINKPITEVPDFDSEIASKEMLAHNTSHSTDHVSRIHLAHTVSKEEANKIINLINELGIPCALYRTIEGEKNGKSTRTKTRSRENS